MSDDIRCRIFTDESKIWNMDMANKRQLSSMSGYIIEKQQVVNILKIRRASRNLAQPKKNYI